MVTAIADDDDDPGVILGEMFPIKTDLVCPNCESQHVWYDSWAFVDAGTFVAAHVCRNCRWWKKLTP